MAESTSSPETSPPKDTPSNKKVKARNHVQKNFEQISLDAKRTGGSSSSSTSTKSPREDGFRVERTKIKAILEAWTVVNPGMTYTQGLNEVAAVLLLRHRGDVSKAMADLQQLASPDTLGGLWSKGMPLYEAGRAQLRLLLADRLPLLQQRLEAVGLDDSAYLPQAWHSLFAKWLPLDFAIAAIDDLLDHSMATVLAITIAVLAELEETILKALNSPDAGIEVLLGPEGCFTRLRKLLKSRGERLRTQWRQLQVTEEVSAAGYTCLEEVIIGGEDPLNGLSRSMCDMVRQEAVLQLATTASRQDDETLIAVFHKCKAAQDKATRDEQLLGDHRYLFKCVVMGDSDVGKSTLVHCDVSGRSVSWTMMSDGLSPLFVEGPTVGIDVSSKVIKINRPREKLQVKLQIWDLSGNASSLSVTRCYLHDMVAAVFVYDITCHESFASLKKWLKEFQQNVGGIEGEHVLFLVGNKLDQESERKVPSTDARDFALQNNMFFYECSALQGSNIKPLFEKVATEIMALMQRTPRLPLGVRSARLDGSFTHSILDRSDDSFYGRMDGCRRATGCHIS